MVSLPGIEGYCKGGLPRRRVLLSPWFLFTRAAHLGGGSRRRALLELPGGCVPAMGRGGALAWCQSLVRRQEDPVSRMTVTVDDELVEEAKRVLGVDTRAEAIRVALEEAVRKRRLQEVLELEGTVEFAGDEKDLLRLRQLG